MGETTHLHCNLTSGLQKMAKSIAIILTWSKFKETTIPYFDMEYMSLSQD